MGKPCFHYQSGHWQRDVQLLDWYTSNGVGDAVNCQSSEIGDYGVNVMSANVVAGRTFVVGKRDDCGDPHAYTKHGSIRLHGASAEVSGATVDATGQRIYLPFGSDWNGSCTRVRGNFAHMIGEDAPFAWWLPHDRYPHEFAATGNLLAMALCQRPVIIWDTRIGVVAQIPAIETGVFVDNTLCAFAGDTMLAVCAMSSVRTNARVSRKKGNIRIHDLRYPNVFYDMAEIDSGDASDVLIRGPMMFA